MATAGLRAAGKPAAHTLRMDDNTYRDDDEDPEAYWRRRVIILVAGLGALALVAWMASGSGGVKRQAADASRAAIAAEQAANGLPAAANATSLAPTPMITVGAFRTTAGTATPTAQPTPSPHKADHRRRGHGAQGHGAQGRCQAEGIVLSLFSSKPSYGPLEHPRFDVYAVSTGRNPCSVSFGPGTVHVIVASRQGGVVWNSARCVQPRRETVKLARGVPVGLSVSWNPAATGPRGCQARGRAIGWLSARATMGAQSSPARYFEFAPSQASRRSPA